MDILEQLRVLLGATLNIAERTLALSLDSPLRGAIPELDSMAVVTLVVAIEEHFGFVVDDDEISGATFETFGTLVEFVQRKLA